jgi:hypothetical protein
MALSSARVVSVHSFGTTAMARAGLFPCMRYRCPAQAVPRPLKGQITGFSKGLLVTLCSGTCGPFRCTRGIGALLWAPGSGARVLVSVHEPLRSHASRGYTFGAVSGSNHVLVQACCGNYGTYKCMHGVRPLPNNPCCGARAFLALRVLCLPHTAHSRFVVIFDGLLCRWLYLASMSSATR